MSHAPPPPPPPPPAKHPSAHTSWWEPEVLCTGADCHEPLLSPDQIARWLSDGFLALDNIWPAELVERAAVESYKYFPLPGAREDGDDGSELSGAVARRDAEGRLWPTYVNTAPSSARQVAMPFFDLDDKQASPDLALNQIGLHPRMLGVAAQLLAAEQSDLRCDLNVLRARYGPSAQAGRTKYQHVVAGTDDGNQEMHVDYGNLSLVVPPRTPRPDAFILILYYTHVAETGGPTHLAKSAPGELTSYSGQPYNPPNGQPGRAPSLLRRLYATERPIRYRPGTAALYRLDSWHRGTPPLPGKHRVAHHIAYRHAESEWISWQAMVQPLSGMPERFLEELSPVQRGVLGFPLPGDRYFTTDTIDAVGRRYKGMDMGPYVAALSAGARL
eukprot:SAG22_NODE_156_length_16999_cov_8.168047_5_plen_387_part_00